MAAAVKPPPSGAVLPEYGSERVWETRFELRNQDFAERLPAQPTHGAPDHVDRIRVLRCVPRTRRGQGTGSPRHLPLARLRSGICTVDPGPGRHRALAGRPPAPDPRTVPPARRGSRHWPDAARRQRTPGRRHQVSPRAPDRRRREGRSIATLRSILHRSRQRLCRLLAERPAASHNTASSATARPAQDCTYGFDHLEAELAIV